MGICRKTERLRLFGSVGEAALAAALGALLDFEPQRRSLSVFPLATSDGLDGSSSQALHSVVTDAVFSAREAAVSWADPPLEGASLEIRGRATFRGHVAFGCLRKSSSALFREFVCDGEKADGDGLSSERPGCRHEALVRMLQRLGSELLQAVEALQTKDEGPTSSVPSEERTCVFLLGQFSAWLQQLILLFLLRQQTPEALQDSCLRGRLLRVFALARRAVAALPNLKVLNLKLSSSSRGVAACRGGLWCRCWGEEIGRRDDAESAVACCLLNCALRRIGDNPLPRAELLFDWLENEASVVGVLRSLARCPVLSRVFTRGTGAALAESDGDTDSKGPLTGWRAPLEFCFKELRRQTAALNAQALSHSAAAANEDGGQSAAATFAGAAEFVVWAVKTLDAHALALPSLRREAAFFFQGANASAAERGLGGLLLDALGGDDDCLLPQAAALFVQILTLRLALQQRSAAEGASATASGEAGLLPEAERAVVAVLARCLGGFGEATESSFPEDADSVAPFLARDFEEALAALSRSVPLAQQLFVCSTEAEARGLFACLSFGGRVALARELLLRTRAVDEASEKVHLALLALVLRTRRERRTTESSALLFLQLWVRRCSETSLLSLLRVGGPEASVLTAILECVFSGWSGARKGVVASAFAVWKTMLTHIQEAASACRASATGLQDACCNFLFALPSGRRKVVYQAMGALVESLGAERVLAVQPYLVAHLLSVVVLYRPLRAAASLALKSLCADFQNATREGRADGDGRRLRAVLLEPLRRALLGLDGMPGANLAARQEQSGALECCTPPETESTTRPTERRPSLLPLLRVNHSADALGESGARLFAEASTAEALAEGVLPSLLRQCPSAAAPLLAAVSLRVSLEALETEVERRPLSFSFPSASQVDAPWTAAEAALLSCARAAGKARWVCATTGDVHRAEATAAATDLGRFWLCVEGETNSGEVLRFFVSRRRFRRGLDSGDEFVRLQLLQVLATHAKSTRAPSCCELQLLLRLTRQRLHFSSAATRSQVLGCVERVLLRCANAARLCKTAARSSPRGEASKASKTLCCAGCVCESERQQSGRGGAGRGSANCATDDASYKTPSEKTAPAEAEPACLRCLRAFVEKMRENCLRAAYPKAPFDRTLLCLQLLHRLHSLCAVSAASALRQHAPLMRKKKSSVLQALSASAQSCQEEGHGLLEVRAEGDVPDSQDAALLLRSSPEFPSRVLGRRLLAMLGVVSAAEQQAALKLVEFLPNEFAVAGEDSATRTRRLERFVGDACVLLFALRQDDASAGAAYLEICADWLFCASAETPAGGDVHLQQTFVRALRDALHKQLPRQWKSCADTAPPTPRALSDSMNQEASDGLLCALAVLTDALALRLEIVAGSPCAAAAPGLSLHGLFSAVERLLRCMQNATARRRVSRAREGSAEAWRSSSSRVMCLAVRACQVVAPLVFAAEGDVVETRGRAFDLGLPTERVAAEREPAEAVAACGGVRLLSVDCRGHPLVKAEAEAEAESLQERLAFCAWRIVKGACEATTALLTVGCLSPRECEASSRETNEAKKTLLIDVDAAAQTGRSLLRFLLACRHMGAAECLGGVLKFLCAKLCASTDPHARRVPRQWLEALLFLLLPRAENEQSLQQDARRPRLEEMLRRLGLRSFGDENFALPPPLRKSATFGFALVAILEAFSCRLHALNLLKALVATCGSLAAVDVGEAVARGNASVDFVLRRSDGASEEGGEDEASLPSRAPSPASAVSLSLAVASLSVAVSASEASDFPLRSASNGLLVAAAKRLAGADDEVSCPVGATTPAAKERAWRKRSPLVVSLFCGTQSQRPRGASAFEFCAGALQRASSRGVSSGGLFLLEAETLLAHPFRRLVDSALLRVLQPPASAASLGDETRPSLLAVPPSMALLIDGVAKLVLPPPLKEARKPPQTQRAGRRCDFDREAAASSALKQSSAVAVLVLLSRADLSSVSSSQPSLAALVSAPPTLEDSEAFALQEKATLNSEAERAAWLRHVLKGCVCALTAPPFAARALAARVLVSYSLQRALLSTSALLLQDFKAVAAAAVGATQTQREKGRGPAKEKGFASGWRSPNGRNGLLLLLLEMVGRPEFRAAASSGCFESKQKTQTALFEELASDLGRAAEATAFRLDEVLILQILERLASSTEAEGGQGCLRLWEIAAEAARAALQRGELSLESPPPALFECSSETAEKGLAAPALQGTALRLLVLASLKGRSFSSGVSFVLSALEDAVSRRRLHPQAIGEGLDALAKGIFEAAKKQPPPSLPRDCLFERLWRFSAALMRCPEQTASGYGLPMAEEERAAANADASADSRRLSQARRRCNFSDSICAPLALDAARVLEALVFFASSQPALRDALLRAPLRQSCEKSSCSRQQHSQQHSQQHFHQSLAEEALENAALLAAADSSNSATLEMFLSFGAAVFSLRWSACGEDGERKERGSCSSGFSFFCAFCDDCNAGLSLKHRRRGSGEWTQAVVRAALPEAEIELRLKAAEALKKSRLGSLCENLYCVEHSLRLWKAALLLLQDEDAAVRLEASTAVAFAARSLVRQLRPAEKPGLWSERESLRLVLASLGSSTRPGRPVSSATGEALAGPEEGCALQLLTDAANLVRSFQKANCSRGASSGSYEGLSCDSPSPQAFPPAVLSSLWVEMMRGSEAHTFARVLENKHCLKLSFEGADSVPRLSPTEKPLLFEEEPANAAADEAFSAQVAARALVLLLFAPAPKHSSNGLCEDNSPALGAVEETLRFSRNCGVAPSALGDCDAPPCLETKEESRKPRLRCKSSWIEKFGSKAETELRVAVAALDALKLPNVVGRTDAEAGGEILLHPTNHDLFIPIHKCLLRTWIFAVASLARPPPSCAGKVLNAAEALRNRLRVAAAREQFPHPDLQRQAEAVVALGEVIFAPSPNEAVDEKRHPSLRKLALDAAASSLFLLG